MARRPKLSADAQAIYAAHAGRDWVTWASIKHTLDETRDVNRIARAWNELTAAHLTSGQLSTGQQCRVFLDPEPQ